MSKSKELPLKLPHFKGHSSFVAQTWQDLSEVSLERRALSAMFLDQFNDKIPENPRLISTAHGKLKKLLFTLPSYVLEGEDSPIWAVYEDLFLKLPSHTEICLVVQECCIARIKKWAKENKLTERIQYIKIPDYINISVWAEDAYVIVKDGDTGEQFFVEPNCFPRWEDGFIAEFASKALKYKRSILPLYFEGGNVLVGDTFFMIGADYPVTSMKYIWDLAPHRMGESNAKLVHRLYNQYMDNQRELIFVGSTLPVPSRDDTRFEMKGEIWREFYYTKNEKGTVQPVFHIDMFISLAGRGNDGKYRILVGDPRLAAKLLNQPVLPYAMVEIFDNVADNLKKIGFEVIRNPLPLIYLDDERLKERNWHFASANNVMVEIISEKKKTVWLPTYGHGNWSELEITDRYNRQIWEKLGFKVIMLGDFHPFAENSGSLHCIKKYLERE